MNKNKKTCDFPGGPVLHFQYRGCRFHPWLGSHRPGGTGKNKQTKNKKTNDIY